jgi:hypothetical protein
MIFEVRIKNQQAVSLLGAACFYNYLFTYILRKYITILFQEYNDIVRRI